MTEIKSLSHTHVAIMDYLMAHPTVHLGDVAKNFGYTQAWLSQIIHSDAFQVMLQEKQGIAFHDTVLPIREKMLINAHEALDKIARMLPAETDIRTVNTVAENMLDRLGFGSKPIGGGVQVNIQNNMITPNANAAEIAAAREMLAARRPALGVQVNDVSVPLSLPRTSSAEMGANVIQGNLSSTDGQNETGEGRAAL